MKVNCFLTLKVSESQKNMFLELILEQKSILNRPLFSKLHYWGHATFYKSQNLLLQFFWLDKKYTYISFHATWEKIMQAQKLFWFSLGPAQYVNKCFGTCRRTECRKKHKVLLHILTSIMWAILCIFKIIQAFTFPGLAVTISITILIIFARKY